MSSAPMTANVTVKGFAGVLSVSDGGSGTAPPVLLSTRLRVAGPSGCRNSNICANRAAQSRLTGAAMVSLTRHRPMTTPFRRLPMTLVSLRINWR